MADYAGTGAHLSPAELRAWTSFLDAGRIIETELAAQLVDEFGMTHREYEVLVRLDGIGGRERMSVLARQIEASAPLVTQTVTRLEERGWVTRETSEADRRGVEASLTSAGRLALARAAQPHAALVRELLLEPLGEDLAIVAGALGRVADHLRAHRAGTACDDPACPLS